MTISYTARLVTGQGQVPYRIQETLTAVHTETKEQLAVEAEPVADESGRFQATFVFLWQANGSGSLGVTLCRR
jgi:hypothetical protein